MLASLGFEFFCKGDVCGNFLDGVPPQQGYYKIALSMLGDMFAMCPALRGSTVSYAGDAHFPKHSLEYSLNFWTQSKKKNRAKYAR